MVMLIEQRCSCEGRRVKRKWLPGEVGDVRSQEKQFTSESELLITNKTNRYVHFCSVEPDGRYLRHGEVPIINRERVELSVARVIEIPVFAR